MTREQPNGGAGRGMSTSSALELMRPLQDETLHNVTFTSH